MEKLLNWALESSSSSMLNKQYSKAQTRAVKLIMKQLPVKSLDFIKQIIIQVSRLGVLSHSLERFEEISRYPNIKNPSLGPSLFTKDHPLTCKFEQLQKLTENSINKLNALFKDFPK